MTTGSTAGTAISSSDAGASPGLVPTARFAPSPTGELHLGNARTALFNLLLEDFLRQVETGRYTPRDKRSTVPSIYGPGGKP